jgi:hypothetical protein
MEEHRLRVFQKRVLGKIFGPKGVTKRNHEKEPNAYVKNFTMKVSRVNTCRSISGLINTAGTFIDWLLNNAVCKTGYKDCVLWKKKW